jgi:LacI family transcriptional regulator
VRRRPTIRDVAERAGVHPATASRALNPALPGRIAEATASKVRAAAGELGYAPDPTARSLRTRRSGIVGVVIPDLTNPVLPPIVRGIEETLWRAGLASLVADTDNDAEREAVAVRELQARRCEGLVIASATRDSATVRALAADGVATVLVTRDVDHAGLFWSLVTSPMPFFFLSPATMPLGCTPRCATSSTWATSASATSPARPTCPRR